jgi:hypothetical protein
MGEFEEPDFAKFISESGRLGYMFKDGVKM